MYVFWMVYWLRSYDGIFHEYLYEFLHIDEVKIA